MDWRTDVVKNNSKYCRGLQNGLQTTCGPGGWRGLKTGWRGSLSGVSIPFHFNSEVFSWNSSGNRFRLFLLPLHLTTGIAAGDEKESTDFSGKGLFLFCGVTSGFKTSSDESLDSESSLCKEICRKSGPQDIEDKWINLIKIGNGGTLAGDVCKRCK